jgi:hypothetical protein
MAAEKRNASVVVALIGSLTVGASVLLWMEPRPAGGGSGNNDALLMAGSHAQVRQLTIAYSTSLVGLDRSRFDGVIRPDGALEWESRKSPSARVLVMGTGANELSAKQAQQLVALVAWLNEHCELDVRNVELESSADSRMNRGLPGEARDLRKLLETRLNR